MVPVDQSAPSSPWIVLARDLRIICSGFGTFPSFADVFQLVVPQFPSRLQSSGVPKGVKMVMIRAIRAGAD